MTEENKSAGQRAEEARAAADVKKDIEDKKRLNPDVYERNKKIEEVEAQRVAEGKPNAESWADKVKNYEDSLQK